MIPRDKATACFDADKLQHPLSLRLCRQGDSFVPFGMKGRKKVSDYLTDRKFSLLRKNGNGCFAAEMTSSGWWENGWTTVSE